MSTLKNARPRKAMVPRPDRVRTINRSGFGWMDACIHRDGWLALLGPDALAVYSFFCLVANRQGVSWYRRARIEQLLGLDAPHLDSALARLYELDLLALRPFFPGAEEGFHQVLSVPAAGPTAWMKQTSAATVSDRAGTRLVGG